MRGAFEVPRSRRCQMRLAKPLQRHPRVARQANIFAVTSPRKIGRPAFFAQRTSRRRQFPASLSRGSRTAGSTPWPAIELREENSTSSKQGRRKPLIYKQLKTGILPISARAVWGTSCRITSFILRFNSLDFGPLAFSVLKNDDILKVSLKIQKDLQTKPPSGNDGYSFDYSRVWVGRQVSRNSFT